MTFFKKYGVAVVIALAVIVFASAVQWRSEPTPLKRIERIESSVPEARHYGDMAEDPILINKNWKSYIDRVQGSESEELLRQNKLEALALREERRAYAGAPPQVPHPIDQRDSHSCLACHLDGKKIGDRFASAMPHKLYTSCTQCHTGQVLESHPGGAGLITDNHFMGLKEAIEGPRWTTISPPQIPHSLHQRENCLSCHGTTGQPALRTTHPERQNCLQCHTESAKNRWLGNAP